MGGTGAGINNEFTPAWLVEHVFSDASGSNVRKPGRRIVIYEASRIAYNAAFIVNITWTSTVDVVQRNSSNVSPSLTVPIHKWSIK